MNWVVITHSGRVWQGMRINEATNYHAILNAIHVEYLTAGGGWDRPVTLLRNGKVVVEGNLADVAWAYGEELTKAVNIATRDVKGRYVLQDGAAEALEGAA